VLDSADEPLIDVSAAAGKISALPLAPAAPIYAHARAGARDWGRALLECEPDGIAIEGDRELLRAVIVALGTGMLPPGHRPKSAA
jgi:hypothetical protein